jgi:hypothetical protein
MQVVMYLAVIAVMALLMRIAARRHALRTRSAS